MYNNYISTSHIGSSICNMFEKDVECIITMLYVENKQYGNALEGKPKRMT